MIVEIEKMSPHKEPATAKKLLHVLADASSSLYNKGPVAPMANSESKAKKLIGEVIISNILLSGV